MAVGRGVALGLLMVLGGIGSLAGYTALAARGTTGRIAAPVVPLTQVDWGDFTYTSACFSRQPQRFGAHQGRAQRGYIHFQVYAPLFGDLTGDGQPEALVPYSCTGADFGGVHLYVFTGTAAQPRLLAEIPSPTTAAVGTLASVHTVTLPVLSVLPEQRVLRVDGVGYSATAPHTCPDLRISLRYVVTHDRLSAPSTTVTHTASCLSL